MSGNNGTGRVDFAIFALLPPEKSRWKALGASTGVQCVALALLLWVPALLPQKFTPYTRYSVVPLVTVQPVTEWKPQPPPKFKVAPPSVPKNESARLVPPLPLRPKQPPRRLPEAQAPVVASGYQPIEVLPAPAPRKPRPEVRTGVLGGSSAPATLNRPPREVQTGGFGDPNGVPAVGNPNKAANIAPRGSFDLPPGPGYGNGSGGARGARGTVASAGFGNGIAVPGNGSGGDGGSGQSGSQGAIHQGVFNDARQPAETRRIQAAPERPSVQPVEILFKPNPVYTQEARALKIEGEVLLEVVFAASGEVRVLRVVRGLGHGLDEAAVAAAKQIRFKPQRSNGTAVDSAAILHVVFQLAY